MRFERSFLAGFNFVARLLGVLWIIGGVFFLVSAFVLPENRVMDAMVGVLVLATGVAFLLAKRVTPESLDRIRGNHR
jgi:uncharacterized membrane protein HdeD (DUF308 family)